MTTALLDADLIIHVAAASFQQSVDWDGTGNNDLSFDPDAALEAAEDTIADWASKAKADHHVLCFSCGSWNFRKLVYPQYKANRVGKEKPRAFAILVEKLRESHPWYRIRGLEADDVLGLLGTSKRLDDPVVVSYDKDMLTLPCRVLNPRTMKRATRVKPIQADRAWMIQTLTGDAVDGYPGAPGIGPVKATKLVDEAGPRLSDMWAAVVSGYQSKGLTEDDALAQARVARILRRTDFNREREEISLWHPVSPTILPLRDVLSSGYTGALEAGSLHLPVV